MEQPRMETYKTESGFLLPSIHSYPPFYTLQPYPSARQEQDLRWTELLLKYARFRRLFTLSVDDAEKLQSEWREVLRNDRINRALKGPQLHSLIETLVSHNQAAYEPPKQTSTVLVYWRKPEEWAEVLHSWAVSTGQLNTILTFYEIQFPPVASELNDIPGPLLRRAIGILARTSRAQLIESAEGGGVRFFTAS